jgi:rhodanese-related sulfurtransferase
MSRSVKRTATAIDLQRLEAQYTIRALENKSFCIEVNVMREVTATDLKAALDAGEDIQLIDVRQPDEYEFARIEGGKLIPLGEIMSRMNEIDPERDTVIYCKMGGRSARAVEALERAGFTGKLRNLRGGITAWSNDVDPNVPKY